MTTIGRLLRREPYLGFAVIMVVLLCYFVISQPWNVDLGMHLATIVRWRADLSDPRNPLLDVPGPSPYYTPYMLCWVLLSLAFDWSQFTVLKIAAGLNVVLLLIGFRVFAGCFTRSTAAMTIGWLAMLLVWGVQPTMWSGLYPLGTLLVSLPFPSTFATGCALILMGLVRGAAVRSQLPTLRRLLVIVILATMIILSHPFVAAATALGCVVLVAVPTLTRRDPRRIGIWAGVAMITILLAACWPWFRLTDLLAAPYGLDELHSKLYQDWPLRYGLLFGTLPALIMRAIRRPRDPLPVLAAVNLAVVIIGAASGHYSLGRMITWAAIPAQLTLGIELVGAIRRLRRRYSARRRRPRPSGLPTARAAWRFSSTALVLLISAVTLVAGGWTQLGVARIYLPGAITRSWPAAVATPYALFGDYRWAADRMRSGEVVLSVDYFALRMLPAYGMYTVQPAYPDPLLPAALPVRRTVSYQFFDDDDTSWQRRAEIVDAYGVDWVIATPEEWHVPEQRPLAGVSYRQTAIGPQGERLYRIERG